MRYLGAMLAAFTWMTLAVPPAQASHGYNVSNIELFSMEIIASSPTIKGPILGCYEWSTLRDVISSSRSAIIDAAFEQSWRGGGCVYIYDNARILGVLGNRKESSDGQICILRVTPAHGKLPRGSIHMAAKTDNLPTSIAALCRARR